MVDRVHSNREPEELFFSLLTFVKSFVTAIRGVNSIVTVTWKCVEMSKYCEVELSHLGPKKNAHYQLL